MNVLLNLMYEGTGYSGWQIQKNSKNTIQYLLEDALYRINGTAVRTIASGRTDAGVHAIDQLVQFRTRKAIPAQQYKPAINHFLPDDIYVVHAREVSEDFHVLKNTRCKTYLYRIYLGADRDVFRRNLTWHLPYPLDTGLLNEAASKLEGTHDFRAFCAANSDTVSFIRTVESINVRSVSDELHIEISGDGFLYKMVRIIVGTLMEIARQRLETGVIEKALASGDRKILGPTAPAGGLFLKKVYFVDNNE